ncbi:diacylglycerol/lipid kinase family protein [Chryseobacterium sp. 3008163]|uniref:diacylglycerol/lipid kinase family protein n=1 Tax=Chryseobacterium sp. 3008163 TaxID=2478663 RepID=UPI001E29895D|nr:acylglycerol kinase family protein [Chryseobacterium sp. 3008163]
MLPNQEAFFTFVAMEKVAFIINPFSAKKNYQPFLNELKRKVENPLYYISESIIGTEEFIQKHFSHTDIFVAIGGDGTISTVAKNLINTDKILAIFPAGSGNGFSNETQFSKNLDELLEKLKQKNPERLIRLPLMIGFPSMFQEPDLTGKWSKNLKKPTVVSKITLKFHSKHFSIINPSN